MTHAWLRAHHGYPAVAGVIFFTVLGALKSESATNLVGVQVRTTWFMLLACVVFQSLLLGPAFGLLEHSLPREGLNRCVQGAAFLGLCPGPALVVACVIRTDSLLPWYLLLCALAAFSAMLLGERAWLPVLGIGTGSILIDHLVGGSPVSQWANHVGTGNALAAALGLTLTYAAFPRVGVSPQA